MWACGSIGCCSLYLVLEHSYLNSLSSGVSTANHSHWLVFLCCNVISRRVSTANFACWLVLVCCNLQSLSLEVSTASLSLIHCDLVSLSSEVSLPFFSTVKWLVFFTSSLSSAFCTVPHSQFLNLLLRWSTVSAASRYLSLSAPSPVFLFLR